MNALNAGGGPGPTTTTTTNDPIPGGCAASLSLKSWDNGFVATVKATADSSALRGWRVTTAALLQALAGFLLAAFPSLSMDIVASALMGAGFGAYMAVDQALITQVLPDADSRAKDLGIMNIGALVPPTLAPLIASVIITSGLGYPALFATVGVGAAVGAALTYQVRSVR